MTQRILRLFGLLLIPVLLAACGGGLSEDDAEKAIKAAFEGDTDEANEFLCEENQVPADAVTDVEGMEIGDVNCTKDGDQMTCETNISLDGVDNPISLTFDIEDDKLCGGDFLASDVEPVEVPSIDATVPAVPDLDVTVPAVPDAVATEAP
jgi:hypothetical protein